MQQQLNGSKNVNVPDHGFDQLAVGLKSAIVDFQHDQSPEALNRIMSALKPIGDYTMQFWGTTREYVRRHPVQIATAAVGLVGAGYLISQIMKAPSKVKNTDRNY